MPPTAPHKSRKPIPFWAWFFLARKIYEGKLYRSDRHGIPDPTGPPYRFGERITLPGTYRKGGVWAMPPDPISTDDPGGARDRLYVYLQERGYGRSKPLFISQVWFPLGMGLNWRYEYLLKHLTLSADTVRLALSIEDGKKYTEATLQDARDSERQMVEDILSRMPGGCKSVTWEEYKTLHGMFPRGGTIRIPPVLNSIWALKLISFFEDRNLLGKTFSISRKPPPHF